MSCYGYLEHSELYHHGVKGMKWGVRKAKDAWKKHWYKKASQWTKVSDFRNAAYKRKGKLKSEYELFKADNESKGKAHFKNKDYRKKVNQYRRDIHSANRDINEMNNYFTTSGQKVRYINAGSKGKKTLHYLHNTQGVAGQAAIATGLIAAGKAVNKANKKRLIKKAEKQYNLR